MAARDRRLAGNACARILKSERCGFDVGKLEPILMAGTAILTYVLNETVEFDDVML